MKSFIYTITDPLGVHARPAGLLSKTAQRFPNTVITLQKGENSVKATQIMKLMGMGLRQGDEVCVSAEGDNEVAALAEIEEFFRKNL